MRPLVYAFTVLGVLCLSGAHCPAQTKAPPATINGRVMDGNKGVGGVVVSVGKSFYEPRRKKMVKATTDSEGWFHLTNVTPGRQNVMVHAPTYVIESRASYGEPGKVVLVSPGETVDNININVKRGAVITGTIKDASGQPVMGERVNVTLLDKQGQTLPFNNNNWFMFMTDDRGVYRLFGMSAGRYRISVGAAKEDGTIGLSQYGHGYFQRTFYPSVTDEKEAKIVEVGEGEEAQNIDITLGRREKSYQASGRVINAETGKPIPGVLFGFGIMREGENRMGTFNIGSRSDDNGEFRIEGLAPNVYGVFSQPDEENEFYSETTKFQVLDADVTDLELKVRRGQTISGVVALDNNSSPDPGVLSKLSQLEVFCQIETPDQIMMGFPNRTKVGTDGSFRAAGLRPGKVRIFVSNRGGKGAFSVMRVERDGIEQKDGFTIAAGENVSGVRVVLSYGTGTISGSVKVEGGTMADIAQMYVGLQKPGAVGQQGLPGSDVDSRGRFMIENVPSGDYEITLNVMMPQSPGQSPRQIAPVKKSVSVSDGGQAEVTLTVDLSAPATQEKIQ